MDATDHYSAEGLQVASGGPCGASGCPWETRAALQDGNCIPHLLDKVYRYRVDGALVEVVVGWHVGDRESWGADRSGLLHSFLFA